MIERYRDGACPTRIPTRSWPRTFDGLENRFAELLDRAELTQALEEIWVRVRRLNRYVEETRPWDLAKDEAEQAPA